MKNKIIIACGIFLYLVSTCQAYEAKNISDDNLKSLEKLDNKIYDLSTRKEHFSFAKVSAFIYKNLAYDVDFTLLKLDAVAKARTSQITTSSSTGTTTDADRFIGELVLTYPIFDAKESNDIRKKILDTKQSIISKTKDYFLLKAELQDMEMQKEILLDLEIRTKSRKLAAVGSYDDWLKTVNDIRKINMDITKGEIGLSESKQILLNFVNAHATAQLEEML